MMNETDIDDIDLIKPIVSHSLFLRTKTFQNPFKTWTGLPQGGKLCRFMKERFSAKLSGDDPKGIPSKEELDVTLPIKKPDQHRLNNPPADKLQYVWIGHATTLVQTDGFNILTDPIWSDRCAPTQLVGPKRYRDTPLTISELPEIHAVVISHNHYDHLDYYSVKELNSRFGEQLSWYVPIGLKSWFTSTGCKTVTELSWWESAYLEMNDQSLTLTCTPAQHWSIRSGFDQNTSLWSSWVIKSSQHNFFFSGDTGYCEVFEQIGRVHGPFDLSAIAIGAYCPRYFMAPQHIDPAEAIKIHKDIKSNLSIGIHWGTFPMGSTEPYMEPKELIHKLQEESTEKTFITVDHGAIHEV